MKVEQTKSFTPVVITLESQEELNALYAVFDNLQIAQALRPAFSENTFWKFSSIEKSGHPYREKLAALLQQQ